jgi:hypothetical protein
MSIDISDELQAVQSVYPDIVQISSQRGSTVVKFSNEYIAAVIKLPPNYPAQSPEVKIDLKVSSRKKQSLREVVESEILASIADNEGCEVLFAIIERFKKFEEDHVAIVTDADELDDDSQSIQDNFGEADTSELNAQIDVIHGNPYTERKSVFLAHFARVSSMNDVESFRRIVIADKKVLNATHNILAYRFTAPGGILYSDYDDDGETAAGGRLLEILRLLGVDGIAVIVSRWFGGTLLGANRFKIINNTARQLLEMHGIVQKKTTKDSR